MKAATHSIPIADKSFTLASRSWLCFTDAKLQRIIYSCKFFKKKITGDSHEPPDISQINFSNYDYE